MYNNSSTQQVAFSPSPEGIDRLRQEEEEVMERRSSWKGKHRHTPYDTSPKNNGSTCSSEDQDSTSEVDPEENHTTHGKRQKRVAANRRERTRMHTVNSAFDSLREMVPTYPSNRKLSKIETLRLACAYISDLSQLLRNPANVHGEDVNLYHEAFMNCNNVPNMLPNGMPAGASYPPPLTTPIKGEFTPAGPEYSTCTYQHYRIPHGYAGSVSGNACLQSVLMYSVEFLVLNLLFLSFEFCRTVRAVHLNQKYHHHLTSCSIPLQLGLEFDHQPWLESVAIRLLSKWHTHHSTQAVLTTAVVQLPLHVLL